ncbi:NAD(P)-binding protein [Hypomontagnella submonticulosa]|nr:NAD(P)-binding protein [Hypomontagnella submonticulosa]
MAAIAITGASGKLGSATLAALLEHNLAPPSSIIALTSSHPNSSTWNALQARHPDLQVRHASFEDLLSFEQALRGVTKLFLVSTPHIALDFDRQEGEGDGSGQWQEVPDGAGREKHHRVALDAAVRAGVPHVYYSSLAFAWDGRSASHASAAGVMRAHLRTEAYLSRLLHEERFRSVTAVREGLYAESWPLYLGYFDASGEDDRTEVLLPGDGKICWTAIRDLGLASALLLVQHNKEDGVGTTLYLSTRPENAKSVGEVAALVGQARGKEVKVKIVGHDEHERFYVEERGKERPAVRWWASTYEALERGECLINDPTLEKLLESVGVKPTSVDEVIAKMVKKE